MSDIAIKVEDVSKRYTLGQRGYRSFREDIAAFFNVRKRKQENKMLWALKDVSFELRKGEAVGLIGPNGAGKSTLLKILAKVIVPTSGTVIARGRIGAMIELAAGFHPELTGRENIYLYGSIVGMKRKEIDAKFDAIVEFSELGKFIDTPLKRYSSGMNARLGFSVSAHIDPDLLLIDEVLAVGDFNFQSKCIEKMHRYKHGDTSIVFVSHNLESVKKICDRTILLDEGRILYDGSTTDAINRYYKVFSERTYKSSLKRETQDSIQGAAISNPALCDVNNKTCHSLKAGDKAVFGYEVHFNKDVAGSSFGFFIRRDDRLIVFDTCNCRLNVETGSLKQGQHVMVEFCFTANLLSGMYHVGSFVTDASDMSNPITLDYIDNVLTFDVADDVAYGGVAYLDPKFRMRSVAPVNP